MNGTLGDLLAGVAEPVRASPLTARRALDGGRRRRRRRRTALLSAALGLLVVAAAGAAAPGLADRAAPEPANPTETRPPDPRDPYLRLLDAPGRGDLIDDDRYTEAVLAAWGRYGSLAGQLVGLPRIIWAGTSPAGPTAVLVQRAELRAEDLGAGGRASATTAIGFVGVDSDGRPRVITRSLWPRSPDTDSQAVDLAGTTGMQAWFVDPEQTVLGVLDVGGPVGYGTRWTYRPDGTRTMAMTPFTPHDGAAFVRLPLHGAGGDPIRVARLPAGRVGDVVAIAGQPVQASPSGTGWVTVNGAALDLDLGAAPADRQALRDRFLKALAARTTPLATPWGQPFWTAAGRLPDGTGVVVGESRLLPDPARVYAALLPAAGGTTLVDGGPVPADGTVPRVRVALPGGRGWVVAEYAAGLRWRTAGGDWSAPARDAALVPADATELEVTRARRAPVVIGLSAGR